MRPGWLAAGVALALAATSGAAPAPYVAPARVPDGVAVLPLPPAPGSPQDNADLAMFRATRTLEGSPRWRMATDDVTNAPLDRYACAMGMRIDARRAPALAALLDRIGTGEMVGPVKEHYHKARPYLGTDAPICEPRTDHLARNGDYPSGHAANGSLEALVLVQLLPDRATPLLARARAYGESRVICGVHSHSAVQAGWLAGSTMFAMLQTSPAYHRDLAAAARELARLRAHAPVPDPTACTREAELIGQGPGR